MTIAPGIDAGSDEVPRRRSVREALVTTLVVGAITTAIVVPFSFGTIWSSGVLKMSAGAANAVAIGIALRVGRRRGGVAAGALIGSLVGIIIVLLYAFTNMRGIGVFMPLLLGLCLGVGDRLGVAPLATMRASVGSGTAVGLLIGLGVVSALAWQGVIGGILMGFSIGSLLGLRRDPARGWRGGLRRPPRWLLVANGAITALIVFGVRFGDRESWLLACVLAILSQYVFPLVSFSLSAAAAEWFRPRIHVYRQLAGYLRVMWVPIGAFAVGYLCIILVFATLAAALYRYDQAAFSGTDFTGQRSVIDDFFRFAVYNVLAPDYNTVAPASGLAHLLVTLQLVFSFGWAVVVFAAVMTHVQPQLDRIARAVLPHHDDDGRDA